MLPKLDFSYLLWGFLPGIPFSLITFLVLVNTSSIPISLGDNLSLASSAYFIFMPLILGIFLDGIRHTLSPLHIFPKWNAFPVEQMKIDVNGNLVCCYNEDYLSRICASYSLNFCMYELFGNFILSLLLSLVLLVFITSSCLAYRMPLISISLSFVILSYICMYTFSKMNDRNLKKWFS